MRVAVELLLELLLILFFIDVFKVLAVLNWRKLSVAALNDWHGSLLNFLNVQFVVFVTHMVPVENFLL